MSSAFCPLVTLKRCFDAQVIILREKGLYAEPLTTLREKLQEFDESIPVALHHPLLIVLPLAVVPLEEQLQAVDLGGERRGYTFLGQHRIEEAYQHIHPYLILGIENGKETLGVSSIVASKLIHLTGRTALTIEQGLALALFYPETFSSHNIHLGGSRIVDPKTEERFVPDFYKYANRIKMKRDYDNDADSRWGSPSWMYRVTL